MAVIHSSYCPVCKNEQVSSWQMITDWSVSKEPFEIWECSDCKLRFTQNAPDQDGSGRYYQSANYISHNDTRKGLINTLYHWVRRYTLKAKRRLVVKSTRRKTGAVLDIGAGTGAFLHEMKASGWQVTGLEPDKGARSIALANYQLALLESENLFRLESGRYDAITLWHVLEHVHPLHEYLSAISLLLKDQGRLIVAVPNYRSGDADYYGKFWAAYDVPRHLYHFSSDSIRTLMQAHGLKVERIQPMWFDSFYVSMLSESYKNNNSNHIFACWQGLKSNIQALKNPERASSLIYIVKKIN